jgi:hypothetical protein
VTTTENASERMDPARTASPCPRPVSTSTLAAQSERAFNAQIAHANLAFTEARSTYEDACQEMGGVLTEQIARRVLELHPNAFLVEVRAAAEYHPGACEESATTCTGHNSRLVSGSVHTRDGDALGEIDPMDPIAYWLERLTPLMGARDAYLTLPGREWLFGATGPTGDCAPDPTS